MEPIKTKPRKKNKISIEKYENKIKYKKMDNHKYNIWSEIPYICPFCSKILNLVTIEQHTRGAHCKKISKILFKDEKDIENIKEKLKNTIYLLKHGRNNIYDKSIFNENEINNIKDIQEHINSLLDNYMENTTDRRRKQKQKAQEQEQDEGPQKQERKINEYGFYEIEI